MKNRIIISALAAVCLLSGCVGSGNSEGSVNVVDIGSQTSSESISGNNQSSEWNGIIELPVSSGETLPSSSGASSEADIPAASSTPEHSSSVSLPESSQSSSSTSTSATDSSSSSSDISSTSSTTTSSTKSSSTSTSSTNSSTTTTSSSTVSTSSSKTSSSSSSKPPVDIPSGSNTYKTLNYDEVKGVWISYLELMNMPSGSASSFRKAIGEVYDNCVELGLNTVYVHVRSHGDAYYNSELFAYTKYLSGGFDALEIMVDEAHKRDLSFQAWINPLRGCSESDVSRQTGYKLGEWISDGKRAVKVNGTYYLNPAYDEVIKLIADGAREIVANYDVDGLHIDDYFYPTTDASFDSAAFKASGYTKLSDFRFANCDKMMKSLYNAVKESNSDAIFGVSCQGNLQNNYTYMYADVKKWCSESGYTDYIMPQIYFGFNNAAQPFSKCVNEWNNLAKSGKIPLIVGVAVSKIGLSDSWAGEGKNEWITDKEILRRQFLESAEQSEYGGIVLFSYRSIFAPAESVKSQVDEEIASLKAVLNQ